MISVITRTKDRKIFLPRVFKSLVEQTYRPIEWVVVNDAGEDISGIIADLKKDADKDFSIKYLYRENSTTMEAATNHGLENADGKYINILDDDDTIDKDFYTKMTTYLSENKVSSIKGAISYSQYIFEEVENNKIKYIRTEPFGIRPDSLMLTDILKENQFPIHSFVYEKKILKTIGSYDESYPVLGDWEFNIRFLEKFDIGIVPEILISYHKRTNMVYGNTDMTALNQHLFYDGLIRNSIMRKNLNLSSEMGQGTNTRNTNRLIHKIESILQEGLSSTHELRNDMNIFFEDKKKEEEDRNKVLNEKDKRIECLRKEVENLEQNIYQQEEINSSLKKDLNENIRIAQSLRIKNRVKRVFGLYKYEDI